MTWLNVKIYGGLVVLAALFATQAWIVHAKSDADERTEVAKEALTAKRLARCACP